jgi:transglutaminase-like putative cysteine protease
MLLLSAVFDNLSPYLVIPRSEKTPPEQRVYLREDRKITTPDQMLVKPGQLLFVVSPAEPVLFWRISTADYYDGFGWYRTTREVTTDEFPKFQSGNATRIFAVEYNMTEKEISLPAPPPRSDLTHLVVSPSTSHDCYFDETGDTYGIKISDLSHEIIISYEASWHHTEIEKEYVSLKDLPQEIRDTYLQLPSLPAEVVQLAERLRRSGMNPVDQILSDAAYLLIDFEYDLDYYMGRSRRTVTRDWVLSYLQWRKGICLDAATALTVILRCQGIPARVSLGYKPTRINGDEVFYYSNTSHAETEAYLPPYGWVRFDATPPSPLDLQEDSGALKPEKGLMLTVTPTEIEAYPGESVFFHLVINNTREAKDHFGLSFQSTAGWTGEVIPASLEVGSFETSAALMEVKIPEDAVHGQVETITVTVTSTCNPEVTMSNTTVVNVGNARRKPTITTITYSNNPVFRGESFHVEGVVATTDLEPLNDVPVVILLREDKERGGRVCGNGFSQNGIFAINGEVPFDIELGDYAVIAVFLGTDEYAASTSDPTAKVKARTYLALDVRLADVRITRPFLEKDHVIISGFLRLDNGTTPAETTIQLEMSTPTSPAVYKYNVATDHGFFVKRFTFPTPGTYELNATFQGRGYIDGTYSYRKMEVSSPAVHSLTVADWIRGEMVNIKGNVSSNNDGIPREPVTITLDGQVLAIVETKPEGVFSYNWEIDFGVQLGEHLLGYTLQRREGIGASQYVNVMARPKLTVSAPEKVSGGDHFTCVVSLRDDQGLPIEEEIYVGDYGLTSGTGKSGNLNFLVTTPLLRSGNMNISVDYKGSEDYLPATAFALVNVQPGTTPILFALTTSALSILGLILYNRKSWQSLEREEREKADSVEVPTGYEKDAPQPKLGKPCAVQIRFPEIEPQLPNVWGIKEDLQIKCTLNRNAWTEQDTREIEFFVNGKRITRDLVSENRPATFSYTFEEKGEHEIGARLARKAQQKPTEVNRMIRIVDYREEVIRLFKTFLEHLANQGIELKEDMTAREVERLLLELGPFDYKRLRMIVSGFERAEYSHHEILRKNYETMYLSVKELTTDADFD